MLNGPFRGITTDGAVIPDLYAPRPEGAPTLAMIEAANALLAAMSPEQKKTSCFPVDSNQWRRWQNTELYLEHYGLRLDEISEPLRDAVLAVLRVSMSQHGYELSRDVMKLNRFLGDIVHGPAVMGEWSYIFCLFGEPSATEPWGWQLFGHHLVLNCFVLGQQMVLTPAFWGAEPNYADHGPFKGIRLFQDEERAGAEADARVHAGAAEARHRRAFDDGRRSAGGAAAFRRQPASRRRVPGQPRGALRGIEGRRAVGRAAARPDGPGREISRRAARRAARGAHRRGREASAGHAFLLDRRVQRRKARSITGCRAR